MPAFGTTRIVRGKPDDEPFARRVNFAFDEPVRRKLALVRLDRWPNLVIKLFAVLGGNNNAPIRELRHPVQAEAGNQFARFTAAVGRAHAPFDGDDCHELPDGLYWWQCDALSWFENTRTLNKGSVCTPNGS